jgi:hypothetical protein
MRIGRLMTGAVAGVAVAAVLASVFPTEDAFAKRRRNRGGKLRLVDVNVQARDGVVHNEIIEFRFTSNVDKATVSPAVFQIRGENALRTGFTKQVPGSFQVQGRTVRFFPRLPTHLRNPDDARGGFYAPGTERDNADENAGLQPFTNYEIRVIGHPERSPVSSTKGRPLDRTYTTRFTTAAIAEREFAFTIDTYDDTPPPRFRFSNPPDKVASVDDLYAKRGGTQGVPSDVAVTLFGTKVPLAPSTVRREGSVELILTERFGDPELRKPMSGTPFVEQNFDTTRLFFVPDFPLPDIATFALRVTNAVKDLTGLYDFRNNIERTRVRDIYEFLDTARRLSPNTPCEQLQDPPAYLIFDWPSDPAERGVLKCNLLALGDAYPDEIDPRVMVLFSTRDEPVSTGRLDLEFVESDGHNDLDRSTASYDKLVPGAAAAIMTIAGGSGQDGDYEPAANETINADDYPNNTINWRRVRIPPDVVVQIRGTRPVTIRALEIEVEGELYADGLTGDSAPKTSTYLRTARDDIYGGDGGPGGGDGGDSRDAFASSNDWRGGDGITGDPGHDEDLVEAEPDDGGRGGEGGQGAQNSSAYVNGGGGGGGGARLAGGPGANSTSTNGWNGKGGAGGAGSDNPDLDPLVGGAGGGSAANGAYTSQRWGVHGGAAGGGGGAVRIQTSDVFLFGPEGVVGARGGRGGTGSLYSAMSGGPAGGGGGGSVLLQSSAGFIFSNESENTDVSGGPGGTMAAGSFGTATFGGTGGEGYVRVEDPFGGYALPGGTTGVFDPVGGGVASYVWTKFIDTGVDGPRILNFTPEEFVLSSSDDAILIEMQMAIEDPDNFGSPLLDALDENGNTTDVNEVSEWAPVRYVDNTGGEEPAIPDIPGYNPAVQGNDVIFDIADVMNGYNYKFVRFRITFQLNETQTSADPLPFVDRVTMVFEFNF